MGSYSQWALNKKVSTVNWVYGPEVALCNDVCDYIRTSNTVSELDSIRLDAASESEKVIWDLLRSTSLLEDSVRLVEISNASRVQDIEPLFQWLTDVGRSARCVILLMSEEEPESAKVKAPKVNVVKCVMPKSSDRLNWVMEKGGLSVLSAKRLLEYKNGDLVQCYNICGKVQKLMPESANVDLSLDTLKSLEDETPSDFVEALITKDRVRAFIASASMPKDQIAKTLGSVEYSLRMVMKLASVLETLPKGRKMEPIPGFPMARVSELSPIARESSRSDIVRRLQIVSMLDSYARQGISEGLLESLVTMW